ncbi:hypothetical protein BAUCODRAFT_59017, partial [Baudoinia panamericana UAMH 10762]
LDRLAQPVQLYISTSRDPYLNLSIEHYLLQKTAPESAVLFLYLNRPSIIIGRNQNPWLEVNLALLNPARHHKLETEPPGLGAVDLVRRRSGGGTVFHDEGNVNWTVICHSKDFTRDKHAEMVVRALRSCGVDRSRVNERHDIVLDQGERLNHVDSNDTHKTAYMVGEESSAPRPLKVSGSAYKLTRQRALHHGTCLLSSPNLNVIPDYLHSPAKPFIAARGVESVSSPVGNILLDNEQFVRSVQEQFGSMYGPDRSSASVEVGEDWKDDSSIMKGYRELQSLDWTYLQTPQFTISNSADTSAQLALELTVRNGLLHSGAIMRRHEARQTALSDRSRGGKLHDISSWREALPAMFSGLDRDELERLSTWLQQMLP